MAYWLYEPEFPPYQLFRVPEKNEFSCSYSGSGDYLSSEFWSPYPQASDLIAPGIAMHGGSIASFFGGDNWDWRDERHNGDQIPYEDYENWIAGDDAHFSTCWEDFTYGLNGNSNVNGEQEDVGDFPQSEHQINDGNMAGETTPADPSHDDPSGYEYWLEKLWEEHTAQDQRGYPPTYSDDRICLDIFGYWPCMPQTDPGSFW